MYAKSGCIDGYAGKQASNLHMYQLGMLAIRPGQARPEGCGAIGGSKWGAKYEVRLFYVGRGAP